MKRRIRNRTIRIWLLAGFGLTILLLTIRHYYEATTLNSVRVGSQSVIQTIAVLNNTIELTLELSYPPDARIADTTAQAIYKSNRSARNTAAIRPLLDSLVSLTKQTPELNPLARRLKAEAEAVLQSDVNRGESSSKQIQRLVRSLRTFRLALADNLLDSQKRIHEHITTTRTLDNIIDGLVLLLASALLYFFYWYTLRRERLTQQVIGRQKELTQYLEAIPEGVAVLNTDRQVVYVNQAGQDLLNFSSAAIPISLADWAARFSLSNADSKNSFQPVDLPLNQALQGEAVSTDNLLVDTGAGFRLLATHARPLYSRDGELVGAISIFRDITEANRKEQELQRARTIAEQSLQEREIFLANISHEIRTPLNAILGFSELLSQRRSDPEEQDYLDGIKLSGNNLLALINELLDISRIESGQLELDPTPIAISEIIQAVESDLSSKAASKGLTYEVNVDPQVPAVLVADPIRLSQILLNFCSNAVKFTKEGFVKVRVHTDKLDRPEYVNVVFVVEDSGVGIADDKLSRIFNRFSRISEDNLFRSAGTGLGLNIAQSLVTLMNGTVNVQSELGKGTKFTISIPFAIPSPEQALNKASFSLGQLNVAPKTPVDRSALSVLVVEDNILNQKVVEGFLSRYHLKPTIANNGLEAVTILREQSFDIVFMDIQMPEMDGYTATKVIREELCLTIPIIAMTAYTMAGERERCLAVGMNEYLSKPVRIEQIDEVLTRFTSGLTKRVAQPKNEQPTRDDREIVNQTYLEEVTAGDSELLAELVSLFTRDLPQYRKALFDAIETKDRLTFKQTAHKFRSSLNSLAMLTVSERLKQLESEDVNLDMELGIQLASLFQDINIGLSTLEKQLEGNITN
jgi:signal transduction histidine kinase/DNA-binding NarL/FixJ family response regulator